MDTVILTLACGKFRFFDKKIGDIGGIPRLLDVGQCNDAYSAIQIAVALAQAFDCGVNDLPLSLILSWYEQKAVVILLSLFSLGIKDIRLGPSLPAFISPTVLNVLVENFACKPIAATAREDLQATTQTYIDRLISSGPNALRICKEMLEKVPQLSLEENKRYTAETIAGLRISDEGQEGMKAFFEKRKPVWQEK